MVREKKQLGSSTGDFLFEIMICAAGQNSMIIPESKRLGYLVELATPMLMTKIMALYDKTLAIYIWYIKTTIHVDFINVYVKYTSNATHSDL